MINMINMIKPNGADTEESRRANRRSRALTADRITTHVDR
jgi:hypothetical protein